MKVFSMVFAITVLAAAPSFAQEKSGQDPSGYVSGFGGAVWSAGNSSSSVLFEGGVRIAPHLMAFDNVGRFTNLQGDLEPTLDAATASLATQGVGVTSGGTLPAWYGVGGLRAEIPAGAHFFPYALGGIGAARLNPSPQFIFASGTLPDGSTPTVGTDVTQSLITGGSFTDPPPSSAFMMMLGGGVQIPVEQHWTADIGYRYSHIAADTTLSATPLNTNVMTFGFGYRF
jgi:opacity protein-like surface antigen